MKKRGGNDRSGSFYLFCELCEQILSFNSRDRKRELIAEYLEKHANDTDTYLLIKLLMIGKDQRTFHLKEKAIIKVFSKILNEDEDGMMEEFKSDGDISGVISGIFRRENKTTRRSYITLKQVDDALQSLHESGKFDHQMEVIEDITYQKMTRKEINFFVRLILKDLKIHAGQATILDAVSESANDCYTMGMELKDIIQAKDKGDDIMDFSQSLADSQDILQMYPGFEDEEEEGKEEENDSNLEDDDEDDDLTEDEHEEPQKMKDEEKEEDKKKKEMMKDEDEDEQQQQQQQVDREVLVPGTRKRKKLDPPSLIKKNSKKVSAARPAKKRKIQSQRANVNMFIKPMLCKATKSFQDVLKRAPNGYFAEIKYDGERIQIHKKGDDFKYWSRRGKPIQEYKISELRQYLCKCTDADSIVLDGEILMVDTRTGNPLPFGALSKKKRADYPNACEAVFLFDIMYLNGKSLLHLSIETRRTLMIRVVKEIENRIMISDALKVEKEEPEDVKETLIAQRMADCISNNLEGLVIKDLKSNYHPNKRHWLKMKKDYLKGMADSADLVVMGAFVGKGDMYGGILKVYLMGCYDQNTKTYKSVCKVGNGHDFETFSKLDEHFRKLMKPINQNAELLPSWFDTDSSHVPDYCLRENPADIRSNKLVWEVTGFEFSKSDHHPTGISIRFPRVTRIRKDKGVKQATTLRRIEKLFEASKEKEKVSLLDLVKKVDPKSKILSSHRNNNRKNITNSNNQKRRMMKDEDEDEKVNDNDEEDQLDDDDDDDEEDDSLIVIENDRVEMTCAPIFKLSFSSCVNKKKAVLFHCVSNEGNWSGRGTMGGFTRHFGSEAGRIYEKEKQKSNGDNQIIPIPPHHLILVNGICLRKPPRRRGRGRSGLPTFRKGSFEECVEKLALYVQRENENEENNKEEEQKEEELHLIEEIHFDRPYQIANGRNFLKKVILEKFEKIDPQHKIKLILHDREFSKNEKKEQISIISSTTAMKRKNDEKNNNNKKEEQEQEQENEIFKEKSICLLISDGEKRRKIKKFIESNEGYLEENGIDPLNTNLIVCDEFENFKGSLTHGKELGIDIVQTKWVKDCVQQKKLLDISKYLLNDSSFQDNQDNDDNEDSLLEEENIYKDIFVNCVFYIDENVEEKDRLKKVITGFGGQVIENKEDSSISHFISTKKTEGKKTINCSYIWICLEDQYLYPPHLFFNM